ATNIQGSTDWIVTGGKITAASVLLNFANWNSPGTAKIDVQSLLLHELGHVFGLLHSCSGSVTDQTTSPSCAIAETSYLMAVMYP
ncbi:M12 family metallo-peptidase, partial [Pseudomonas sp. GW456-11-11-14-TSB2]|uniref:M12 family metallo-peptidase n=1 Tax=Pseudomonas sp. GW456-11-11-14-TSB2 TaxID=2751348 RepID=UPI0011AED3AD